MRIPSSVLALALVAAAACSDDPRQPAPVAPAGPSPATTDLEELHAFARLYGYVRYFHPSDEAAALDWDGFAIHGVQRVTEARTRDELAQVLEALFLPVAPTLDVFVEGQAPRDAGALLPAGARDLPVVAWQHLGYGLGDMITAYHSGRTHRSSMVPQGYDRRTVVTQELDAEPLRDRKVRLEAWVRVDPEAPAAGVRPSLSIARTAGEQVRVVGAAQLETHWAAVALEAHVPHDAKALTVGLSVAGTGAAWLDDVSLAVEEGGAWQPVALDNPGFEADEARPRKWDVESGSFEHRVGEQAHGGQRALHVSRRREEGRPVELGVVPSPREPLVASLGAGLRCQLPLALHTDGAHTLGPADAGPPAAPIDASGVPRSAEHPAVRTAAVIVAWNVFQHFYPYFDVVDVSWEGVLDQALADVHDGKTVADGHRTLRWMVAQLRDGHGNVVSPAGNEDEAVVPVRMAWVEGQAVVMAAAQGSPLERGDVVVRIDGQDVAERLAAETALTSGSPQWIRHRILAWGSLTQGPLGAPARIEVQRGDEALTLEVARGGTEVPPTWERPAIQELPDGVWVVDLEHSEWSDVYAKIDAMAKAPGVVFDARGYPNGTHPVLRHLMTAPEQARWMFVPKIAHPDRQSLAGWEEHGWDMEPATPHIEGKVAFITGGGAISYAESTMGYVEALHLGEIVGGPTAGANGNVNPFTTPGGYTIIWTGMRVTKHDGRQHHTLGIQPTVPAEPTLAGIREGRDELLERALAVVRAR